MADEVVKYIVQNRKKGHLDSAIKESLRSVGYTSAMISEAFSEADKKASKSSLFSGILVHEPREPKAKESNPFSLNDMQFINFLNDRKVIIPALSLIVLIVASVFAFENPIVKNGFTSIAGKVVKIFSSDGNRCGTQLAIMMLEGSEKVCYINGTSGAGIQFLLHNRNNKTIDSVNVIIQGSKKESRFSISGPIDGGGIMAKVIAYDEDTYGDIGRAEIIPVVGEEPCYTESLKMVKMKECTI